MTTFHSDVVSIYAPSIGATMRFEDGAYSTDDPDEIRVLRNHSDVTEALDEGLKRDGLNAKARELGVESPERLPNKQAVLDAIKDAETAGEAEQPE